jgi:6-pyruvoyl-tetrahydropterin synthase
MEFDLNKITQQIYLAKIFKSTERIICNTPYNQRKILENIYKNFEESLMLTNEEFFQKITNPTTKTYAKCKLLILDRKIENKGIIMSIENLKVLSYYKNEGLKNEENPLFVSKYFFEKNELEEGMPVIVIKDITEESTYF